MKYDNAFIEQVRYGNPSRQDIHNMKIENYLDSTLPYLTGIVPPTNNSPATNEELNMLIDYSEQQRPGGKEIFDNHLVPFITSLYIKHHPEQEAAIKKLTADIVDDILPLITKLKYFFQRPRPYQLAYYKDLALFPSYSKFVSSPSYPSGHTTMGTVIAHVLGNRFPQTIEIMNAFMRDVSESRLYMGVHYPSDNNMATIVAKQVVQQPQFIKKYEL